MGLTKTPKYRVCGNFVCFDTKRRRTESYSWDQGRPTLEKLLDWRKEMNESLKEGGCNDHLNQSDYGSVWIETNQLHPTTIMKYTPPMFEVA